MTHGSGATELIVLQLTLTTCSCWKCERRATAVAAGGAGIGAAAVAPEPGPDFGSTDSSIWPASPSLGHIAAVAVCDGGQNHPHCQTGNQAEGTTPAAASAQAWDEVWARD